MKNVAEILEKERHTDLGNARRLVGAHGNSIRYVPAWGQWLVWDGRRWKPDQLGRVQELAKKAIRSLYEVAARIEDDDHRDRLVAHARKSERRERLAAMVALARTDPRIAVEPSELDADPWSFNCANGTVDLKTGKLREHRRADLITKLSPVEHDPDAKSDLWDRVLVRSTANDGAMLDYLQRLFGMSLIGRALEEVLLLMLGAGATAKTTLLEAFRGALGEYAATADGETFLRQNQARGARNDLARLTGVRLVIASELPPGRQLDAATVKQITGGDTLAARFLYRELFEYLPQFLVCIAANHAPTVRGDDTGIWRRLKVLPFDQVIPPDERDASVKEKLRDPADCGPAVLAWMVEGCLMYQKGGLREPKAVESATRAYKDEMSIFDQFIEDRCVVGQDRWVPTVDLNGEFGTWQDGEGYRYRIGPRRLREALRSRGFEPCRRGGQRGWQGLALVSRVA